MLGPLAARIVAGEHVSRGGFVASLQEITFN
jgi:hypothetical protein